MNFVEEYKLAEKLVKNDGYISEMIINYLVERKIYHTTAVLILSSLFSYDRDFSRELIYSHEYYAPFENEVNPFNEEIGEFRIRLNDEDENNDCEEDCNESE